VSRHDPTVPPVRPLGIVLRFSSCARRSPGTPVSAIVTGVLEFNGRRQISVPCHTMLVEPKSVPRSLRTDGRSSDMSLGDDRQEERPPEHPRPPTQISISTVSPSSITVRPHCHVGLRAHRLQSIVSADVRTTQPSRQVTRRVLAHTQSANSPTPQKPPITPAGPTEPPKA